MTSLGEVAKPIASQYYIALAEATSAEVDEGTAEALAMTEAYNELADWIYDATAEYRTAYQESGYTVGGIAIDIEDQPGLLYSGPTGASVRVAIEGLVTDEGAIIAAEEGDYYTVAIMQNGIVVCVSDEGFVDAADAEPVTWTGLDTYVTLTEGDCIQVAIWAAEGNTDGSWDVAPANLVIT